jgi:uroporphyrinogen-III decarboxylase
MFLGAATPGQVREEVRRILDTGIRGGGRFILREGNNLPPDVGLEQLWAMYDTVREFGRY